MLEIKKHYGQSAIAKAIYKGDIKYEGFKVIVENHNGQLGAWLDAPCGCPQCDNFPQPGHSFCEASHEWMRNDPNLNRQFAGSSWRWYLI